jgi:hypothetical protein
MNTLEFLRAILPEDGVHYLAIFKPGFHAPAHKAFSSLETMADAIVKMDAGDWTVYHACGSFKEEFVEVDVKGTMKKKYRVEQNWNRAKAFWVDLDCGEEKAAEGKGYLTKREAATAMKEFCEKTGFPKPFYVDSGNGIHAYWPLTQTISAATWVKMATVFKDVLAHHEVLADPSRTSDFASILRPVGSHNKKTDDFKPVVAKNNVEPIDPKVIADVLKQLAADLPKKAEPKKYEINDDLTGHLPQTVHMDSSARTIAEKCNQMAIVRDSLGDVDYEHWRGALGIIKFCVEGNALAHEWSEGHPEYDYNATEDKLDSWEAAPTTCEFFSRCNPAGCANCPSLGQIKTPMVLGRIMPESKEEIVEAKVDNKTIEVEVPAFPEGYKWDGTHMFRIQEDKDGNLHPSPFAMALFYPVARIKREDGKYAVAMRMHFPPPFNKIQDFEIESWVIASPQRLAENLADHDIFTTGIKGANDHMSAYLKASIEKLKREAEEMNTLTSYGWKDDYQSFLIGDRLYHKDGTVRRVITGGNARAKLIAFPEPRGTSEGYAEALNFLYARPGMLPMQYAIASGFGSILSPLAPTLYKGLMLAITGGKTAKGKTTVCYAAMYAFGNADKMKIGTENGSTINARMAMVSTYQNLPLLFDEFTKMEAKEFSQLAYQISQGLEKDRMSSGKTGVAATTQLEWALSPYVTGNVDFHGLLASEKHNSEAEAVRVIQIRIDQYKLDMASPAQAETYIKQMELNMGAAGDKFIRYVVQNREDVLHRMGEIGKRLEAAIPESGYRFYRWHAMCSLAALSITNELGITKFDMDAIFEFVIKLFHDLAQVISHQNTMTDEDALDTMITELSSRFITSHDYRHAKDALGPEQVQYRGNANAVAGRYIQYNKNKPSELGGKLFISRKAADEWCRKHQVDLKNVIEYGKSEGLISIPAAKFSLGKGTTVKTGNTTCICVDMVKLESQTPNGLISLVSGGAAVVDEDEKTGT